MKIDQRSPLRQYFDEQMLSRSAWRMRDHLLACQPGVKVDRCRNAPLKPEQIADRAWRDAMTTVGLSPNFTQRLRDVTLGAARRAVRECGQRLVYSPQFAAFSDEHKQLLAPFFK